MLDSNMFFRERGAANLVGGIKDGMTIGDMMRKRKRDSYNFEKQKEDDQRQATVRDIFKANFKPDETGKYSLDRENTLGQLFSTDPQVAMGLQRQWAKEDQAQIDRDQIRSDREFDRNYKNQMLKNTQKKEDFNRRLKEEELDLKKRQVLNKADQTKADQYKVGGFYKRAEMAEEALGKLSPDVGTGWTDTFTGSDYFPEMFKGEERKLFDQSQRNFISAVLRRESGAAISDQEMENESKKYFAQPGDSEKVLAQKAQARQQAINNLKAEAGNAIQKIATASGGPESPMEIPGIQNAYAANPVEHPQKNEALKWAKQNKNDPRAKEILKRLGVE